jgi:uncharacterized membrane protein YeaQ/YmgE (transglycosylase-associated protein family)
MTVELLLIFAVVCAFLANSVAPSDKKNLGFILGLVLGPIGVLVAVLLRPNTEDAAPSRPMNRVVKFGMILAVVILVLTFMSHRPL